MKRALSFRSLLLVAAPQHSHVSHLVLVLPWAVARIAVVLGVVGPNCPCPLTVVAEDTEVGPECFEDIIGGVVIPCYLGLVPLVDEGLDGCLEVVVLILGRGERGT